MKNGRFSDTQIMGILKQAEGGVPVVNAGVKTHHSPEQ